MVQVKMESRNYFSSDEDKDETLVTPRFDSGEAETARPVVPLAVVSSEAETYDAPPTAAARRASWPLALVLVSALAGSVVGGGALYLFQKSRQQRTAPVETQQQTQPTDGASDAAAKTQPVAEPTPAPSPSPELPEEVAEVPVTVGETTDKEERADADKKRDEADDDDAAPRERPAAAAPVKRGKKGEHEDDNGESRESRPRRVADSSPDEDEEYDDRREARRVGSIVYDREARRERRRQRRQPAVDRVRGIFEGQP